jgi:hypothetical protein
VEKLVYLVWDRPSTDPVEIRERALADVVPQLRDRGASSLQVHVDDDDATIDGPMPPPGTELPVRMAFSLWLTAHDRRAPIEAVIAPLGVRTAGYLVTEATMEEHGEIAERGPARDWADGERSPGIVTFTVLRRNPTLDPRTFRELWYGHQGPMSRDVQPRRRYVRNTVTHPVTAGALPYDGIVHESWESVDVVADPIAFHGGPEIGPENLRVMLDSVTQCFDLPTLRSVAMSEYLFTES